MDVYQRRMLIVAGVAALILSAGTLYFAGTEEWALADALYYTSATFATVGYGDLTVTASGPRVVSIGIAVAGIVLVASFMFLLVQRSSMRRKKGQQRE